MKKLSIKDIIEFRRRSDRSKKTFATNIQLEKEKASPDGGGDYWISSISAISKSFKLNDNRFIDERRAELEQKFDKTDFQRTKTMYKRNIDILYIFEDFDFAKLKPEKFSFLKKHKKDSILPIRGLDFKVTPSHLFTYSSDEIDEIGAIWFVAKLDGFRKEELGMFVDILYRYLKIHYSKDYTISPKYCIAVDVVNKFSVTYQQLEIGEIDDIFLKTVDEFKKLM